MADQLQSGSTCGGYTIKTKKDIPVMFRVNGNYLEFSIDGGTTWTAL
jgi:hypothetical protein